MSKAGSFRALLAAQWLVPAFLVALESTVLPASRAAEPVGAFEPVSSAYADGEAVAMVLLLGLLVATTVGLWTFRRWAPPLYGVALFVYAVILLRSQPVDFSGIGQLVAWLDGVLAGGVAGWLVLARDTLPFPRERSMHAG